MRLELSDAQVQCQLAKIIYALLRLLLTQQKFRIDLLL